MTETAPKTNPCEVCGRPVVWPDAHCAACDYCEECGGCHAWKGKRGRSWRRIVVDVALSPVRVVRRAVDVAHNAIEAPFDAWVKRGALRDRRRDVARGAL